MTDDVEDPAPDMSETEMVFGEHTGSGDGELREELAKAFLPDESDHLAKTDITQEQVGLIASFRSLLQDPDISQATEERCLLWLEMMMKGYPSVEGMAREDIINVFETMGSQSSAGETIIMQGNQEDEDDDDGGWFF